MTSKALQRIELAITKRSFTYTKSSAILRKISKALIGEGLHMVRTILSACIVCCLIAFYAIPASAEKRFALLIGNQSYSEAVGPLKNPHNDIALVGASLKSVGFEITVVKDANFATLHKAVNRHIRRLQSAGDDAIGFLYYSGHGAADRNTRINYLIPVDVTTTDNVELWDSSVQLRQIIGKLRQRAANATHFVIFDACRNSLRLKQNGKKALIQSKGFTSVGKIQGMLIAYATAESEVASDEGEDGGSYAKALSEEIIKPDLESVTMFRNVQLRVKDSIGQEPWLSFGELRPVHFAGKQKPPLAPPTATSRPSTSACSVWPQINGTNSVAQVKAFLSECKSGIYHTLAEAYLKELRFTAIQKPEEMPPRSPEQVLNVGLGFYKGKGDKNDLTKAAENFANAAEAGSPQAMYWLGRVNELGEGVPKNLDQAVYWYERASRKKVSLAQNALGDLHRNGTGVPRDLSQALKYYKLAAEQGFPDAMTSIGVIYASGNGGGLKDYAKAADWYRRAAKKGSATAMNNLGVMYAKGYGVDRDDSQAVFWYKKAADKDYVPALLNIAWRYDSGLGVPIDPKVSSQFFVSAVRKGSDEARQTLVRHADKLSNETRMEIQYRLREAGHDIGKIDGLFGSRTSQALEALVFGK